jgi:hypothetical protein
MAPFHEADPVLSRLGMENPVGVNSVHAHRAQHEAEDWELINSKPDSPAAR